MKKLFLIFITVLLSSIGCSLRENAVKKQEVQIKETESKRQEVIKKEKKDKIENLNDNLIKKFIQRYPSALITDSIQESYTYFLQQKLSKDSNLLFFSEADIKDFEGTTKGYYLITVNSYFPRIIGQFKVREPLVTRLITELKPNDTFESGCFVVSVKDLYPVNTDITLNIEEFYNTDESFRVSEDDIRNNVRINLDPGSLPLYFINGDLVDYFILNIQ